MRRKGLYVAIGLCGSLFLHGLMVWLLLSMVVSQAIGDALWAVGRALNDPQSLIAQKDTSPQPRPQVAREPQNVPIIVPREVAVLPQRAEPLPAPLRKDEPPPKVTPPPLPKEEPVPPPPPPVAKLPEPVPVVKQVPPPPPKEVVKVEPPPPPKEVAKVEPVPKVEAPKPEPPPQVAKADPPKPEKLDPLPKAPAVPVAKPPPPPPPPVAKAKPPAEPEEPEPDALDPDHVFGEQNGKGTAVNSSPEPGVQQARKGEQDQAALAKSQEGVVKPLDQVDLPTGKKPPGGGPAGGGGGAIPQPVAKPSEQVVATAGPGGIPGPLTPAPERADVRPQVSRAPDRVGPDKPDAAVRTAPTPGGPAHEAQEATSPVAIGLWPKNDVKIGDKKQEAVAAAKGGGGGAVPGLSPGPDAGPKAEQTGPNAPKIDAAPGRSAQAAVGRGAGDIPLNMPTSRPTSPQLASSIGPRDLPPGKKNPAPGDPGPGDGPGEGAPPSRSPIKDPASIAESESDAFSTVSADMFVRGGVKAKAGRKVQTVKPRLGEHALMDMATMGRIITIFRVSVSKEGRVTNVQVRHASGSDSVDLETSLAIYRWWIEPKRGADGLPVDDTIWLTIVWH